MRIVLDTNVLVSGLLNPNGAPGRILDLIIIGKIQALYDDRVLSEYQEVLARPQLGIDPALAQAVVGHLRLAGERITALPVPDNLLPDMDDLPFVEIFLDGKADALVTGNEKHFQALKDRGGTVLSPVEFLTLMQR